MSGRRRAVAVLAGLLGALMLLAGCTGVPTSSGPQTVEPVNLGVQSPAESIHPTHNGAPRAIVQEFLLANAADPGKHTSARSFLTRAARNRWTDNTVTIVTNEVPGTYDPVTRTIPVFGQPIGSIDKTGRFTPVLEGDGGGGARVSYQFKLATVDGQFRIDQLRPGLLLTSEQFADNFPQQPLFFFDDTQRYLVPDPRYTDIQDRGQLSEWLIDQLIAGPRDELQNAVTSDTVPAQADASRITVQPGAPTRIEIPGSSQLDPGGRNRLAAQLAWTLDTALSSGDITITDAGAPVWISQTHSTRFSSADFKSVLNPPLPPSDVYYLSNGRVFTQAGKALAGPLGRGTTFLASVALSRPSPTGPLLAAGVHDAGSDQVLYTGTSTTGVRPTTVHGQLSRPAFAPGRKEVWIGVGTQVYRVTVNGTTAHPARVPMVQAPGNGQIRALRLSPDGSRIAVVLAAPGKADGQLCIGSIVRSAGEVRIDALEPISPQQALVTDVGWLSRLRLFAVGHEAGSSDPLTFDTGVDGTDWSTNALGLTPGADSVTVAVGASAWVSARGFVWVQRAGHWDPPTGGQTPGTDPVYLE
jgi:Lipoprotein LpqB beta-propeller domain